VHVIEVDALQLRAAHVSGVEIVEKPTAFHDAYAARALLRAEKVVRCHENRDAGILTVEIGIAPVKPAEFVIFRISQWQGGAETAE
jgi:phage tail sheath protein FI